MILEEFHLEECLVRCGRLRRGGQMGPALRGVVLDFGNVIAAPKSGIWTIPDDIDDLFQSQGMKPPTKEALRTAQREASHVLNADHTQQTTSAEANIFATYYAELLTFLGVGDGAQALAAELAHDEVYTDKHIFYYPDVAPFVLDLHLHGMEVGILSDNWPSLLDRLDRLGILRCLKTVVVSSIERCCKPDAQVFKAATDRMTVPSANLLFVDDDIENLDAAHGLGFNVVLMNRQNRTINSTYKVVKALDELRVLTG
jgi:HAD superfamily hydrolase (TIGR01509 family)